METFHLRRSIEITALFLLIFVSKNASFHVRKGYIRIEDDKGPVMNNHSPYLVITTNSSLSLTCEGHHPITWNSTIDLAMDERAVIHQRPVMKGFKSTLTVESVQSSDTGWFTCFYLSNETASPLATNVYVYVTDPEHLLVPMGQTGEDLVIKDIQEGAIPCKPTHPAVNVTLVKFPEQEVITFSNDVEYDPTKGFTLKFPNIFFTGLFECNAVLGQAKQTLHWHLLLLSNKSKPPRPQFDPEVSNVNLENKSINLTCTVTIHPSEKIQLKWIYPNPQNPNFKIFPTEQVEIKSPNGYNFLILRSTLIASHLGIDDGGRYACILTDAKNKSETAEMYVPIESPTRIIGSNMDGSSLKVELGDEIKLRCQADGYPKPEIRWYKNNVNLDPLHSRRYIVELESKFIIEEVTISDSGLYKCIATNRGGTQTRNVTVVVVDPNYTESKSETTEFIVKNNQDYIVDIPLQNNGGERAKTTWWLTILLISLSRSFINLSC